MFKKILLIIAIICCSFSILSILGTILTPPPYSAFDILIAYMNGAATAILIISFFI